MKRNSILTILLLFTLMGCAPETDYLTQVDYNRIGYFLENNFNLSTLNNAVRRSGLQQTLRGEDGPFTLIAPTNTAFVNAGYDGTGILSESQAEVVRLVNYHLLDGVYELDKLPFLFNQVLRGRGGNLYVTRWVKGQDTILTINGKQVLEPINYTANNGLIQVVDAVLEPSKHATLYGALLGEESVTLFAHAITRAGMEDLLSQEGVALTIFTPNNTAMAGYGYPTLESIESVDPNELSALVRYHIVSERRFVNDYMLTMPDPSEPAQTEIFFKEENRKTIGQGLVSTQFGRMLDGNMVTFVVEYTDWYAGTEWEGEEVYVQLKVRDVAGNRIHFVQEDIVADNGVLHVVDGVLRNRL